MHAKPAHDPGTALWERKDSVPSCCECCCRAVGLGLHLGSPSIAFGERLVLAEGPAAAVCSTLGCSCHSCHTPGVHAWQGHACCQEAACCSAVPLRRDVCVLQKRLSVRGLTCTGHGRAQCAWVTVVCSRTQAGMGAGMLTQPAALSRKLAHHTPALTPCHNSRCPSNPAHGEQEPTLRTKTTWSCIKQPAGFTIMSGGPSLMQCMHVWGEGCNCKQQTSTPQMPTQVPPPTQTYTVPLYRTFCTWLLLHHLEVCLREGGGGSTLLLLLLLHGLGIA